MRFPLSISTRDGRLRISLKKWSSPSAGDESAWIGSPYFGGSPIEGAIERVDDQLKQNKSWVYICVGYNARQVARQKMRLYVAKQSRSPMRFMPTKQIEKDRLKHLYKNERLEPWLVKAVEVEEVTEHPFYTMMKQINPQLNQSDMWMLTETYMGLTGNCYWWKRPNRLGVPYQLWIKETQFMTPKKGKTIDKYVLTYEYDVGVKKEYYDPKEIVHHKYPNPYSMILGLSPVEGLSDAISVNECIYFYERATFRNMARPDLVMSFPESVHLQDEQFKRIDKEWNKKFGGPQKSGKLAIAEGGAKIEPISLKPRELAHLEGRKMTREEIADGYGIPMALLSPDKVNLANAKVAYAQYMRDTIDPKLKLYEQKINEQLLPDYEGGENLFCAFDECVPEDREFQLKEMESRLKTGYDSINIQKEKEGEEAVPWGDQPILPMNMQPLGSVEPPPKKGKEEEQEELKALADAIAREIFNKSYKER